jgi:hypothetical protein
MMTRKQPNNLLRAAAILALSIGAIISAILTVHAGRKNASVILPAMFLIWVLAPFIMLLFVHYRFKRYIANRHCLFMIMLSILSVLAYTGVLNPVNLKVTPIFLFTPLISWMLIIIGAIVIKRSKSG